MADPQPPGDLIDKLGVTMDIADGDMVTDVMVITKIVDADGHVCVGLAVSEGCTWLDQLGLMQAARGIAEQGGFVRPAPEEGD